MGLLKELVRRFQMLRHKPKHWQLRPDTFDRRAFREVVIHNEYKLPARLGPDDVVLDIGAHIGSFAYAALKRGAGKVYCCEPNPENFELLQHNLAPFGKRVRLFSEAVWRSDRPAPELYFQDPADRRKNGAGRVALDTSEKPVSVLPFDELVTHAAGNAGRIRVLKLDCEGAEWPILLTSRMLHRIDAICGEYHLGDCLETFILKEFPGINPALLGSFLRGRGFDVRVRPVVKNPYLGLFFAERTGTRTLAA